MHAGIVEAYAEIFTRLSVKNRLTFLAIPLDASFFWERRAPRGKI